MASFLLVLLFSIHTFAQVAPAPVCCMAYATVDENTLYVHGGMDVVTRANSGQFFALDLTVPSWNTASPPWRQVASNGVVPATISNNAGHSASVSRDSKTISFWMMNPQPSITNFNIAAGTWEALSAPVTMTSALYALPAITDPNTGLVYVLNALTDKTMLVFNPVTRTTISAPMPPMMLTDWFPAIWSTLRGSILVLGGEGAVTSYFYEFKPPSGPWTEVVGLPLFAVTVCLVMVSDKSKVVYEPCFLLFLTTENNGTHARQRYSRMHGLWYEKNDYSFFSSLKLLCSI
jgi:hypothetical protein